MATRAVRFVICEPCRLIYRPIPKCASTTMYSLLAALGTPPGGGRAGNPRHVLPLVRGEPRPGRGGSYEAAVPLDAVTATLRRYEGYRIFSVIRDPFDRTVSNYHNKLNRFAKHFSTALYTASYVAPLVSPPHALGSDDRIRWLQRHISFDRFVDRLRTAGVDWDVHFRPQVRLLALDLVAYDRLIPMESLAAGLRDLLASDPEPARGAAALAQLGRWNATASRDHDPWTSRTLGIVAAIYAADLDRLGYRGRQAA